MAKIKRRKLRWSASESAQTVGYKLYWAENGKVDYDSPCEKLGNVTAIVLPDDVEAFRPESGSVEIGITAVDELGNESDLITLSAPYQFSVPQAPEELWIENPDDNSASKEEQEASVPAESVSLLQNNITPLEAPVVPAFADDAVEDEQPQTSVNYLGLHE